MSAIDKLVTATQAIMGEQIAVESDDLGTVYVKPCISAADRGRIHEVSKQEGTFAGMVDEIILRAHDADGKPLFGRADRLKLLKEVDSETVSRLYNLVRGVDFEGKS